MGFYSIQYVGIYCDFFIFMKFITHKNCLFETFRNSIHSYNYKTLPNDLRKNFWTLLRSSKHHNVSKTHLFSSKRNPLLWDHEPLKWPISFFGPQTFAKGLFPNLTKRLNYVFDLSEHPDLSISIVHLGKKIFTGSVRWFELGANTLLAQNFTSVALLAKNHVRQCYRVYFLKWNVPACVWGSSVLRQG